MIEVTLHNGKRTAVKMSEVAAVMEMPSGCRVVLKSGWAIEVTDPYDKIGNAAAWRIQ